MLRIHTFVVAFLFGAVAFTECAWAQAFFPIERIDTDTDTHRASCILRSQAMSLATMPPTTSNGAAINSDVYDPNLATNPQASTASAATASATSSVIPIGQTLPVQSGVAMAVESTITLAATWIANTGAAMETASLENTQSAVASGEFEVLANSSYPLITSGTLEVEMLIISSSDYPGLQINASAGGSFVGIINMGATHMVFGDLDGYGPFMYTGAGEFPGGYFTAFGPIAVGDEFTTAASAWGTRTVNIGGNSNASGGAAVTATVSAYVSYP